VRQRHALAFTVLAVPLLLASSAHADDEIHWTMLGTTSVAFDSRRCARGRCRSR
jgi:hypothetical protein